MEYNQFKNLREASGLTRPEFAKKFKIPYRTVQSWELYNGESVEGKPCPDYLYELIEFRLKHEKEQ